MPVVRISLALLIVLLLAPAGAQACGGLFCSSATLQAVDQAKERILFEVVDDTVITHVEIQYSGNPREFSWVVPVPETPDLDIVPASTLRLLDVATAPGIIPPPIDWSDVFFGGDDDDDLTTDDDDAADDDDATGPPPVEVEDLPVVGPFDPEVISSTDPEALADWLQDNGYLITDGMRPLIAGYVEAGMKFLGMKLVPGAGVQDIAPIRMKWAGDTPSIPLRLTAVGADPGMQLVVFLAGDSVYEPQDWGLVQPSPASLRADPRTGENNYQPWLAWQFDQTGGRAFALEYADDALSAEQSTWAQSLPVSDLADAREYLADRLSQHAWVTRLYTTIDPSEMLDDPLFTATDSRRSVGALHDLRDQEAVYWDQQLNPPLPCNDLYCGAMGACATTETPGLEGCVCERGSLARAVQTPQLGQAIPLESVICVDEYFDPMGALPEEAGDPCGGYSCGDAGMCIVVSGKPTCDCPDDHAAVPWGAQLRCVPAVDIYEPEQLLWPCFPRQPDDEACTGALRVDEADEDPNEQGADEDLGPGDCSGCDASSGRTGAHGLLFLLALAGWRRREGSPTPGA